MSRRSYRELIRLETFEERFEYLRLPGMVGESTFGFDRYLNQTLYRSVEWRNLRNEIIVRDEGCDLAFPGYEIYDMVIVHHMNPLTVSDIKRRNPKVFDRDGLVCVSHRTHMAIHYGDLTKLPLIFKERSSGDTTLW